MSYFLQTEDAAAAASLSRMAMQVSTIIIFW